MDNNEALLRALARAGEFGEVAARYVDEDERDEVDEALAQFWREDR